MTRNHGRVGRARQAIRPRAFFLVEVLVVIGILTVLVALLLPALGMARRQSETTACLSKEYQWAHQRSKPHLPHGQVKALKSPERVFFAIDGNSRERFFCIWEMNRAPSDLRQWQEADGRALDYTRHACRANVLFADWHVQSVPLTPAGLAGVLIAEAHPRGSREVEADLEAGRASCVCAFRPPDS